MADNPNNIPSILGASKKTLTSILNQLAIVQKAVQTSKSKPSYIDLSDSMDKTFKNFSKDLMNALKGNTDITKAVSEKLNNLQGSLPQNEYKESFKAIQSSLDSIKDSLKDLTITPPQPTPTNNHPEVPNPPQPAPTPEVPNPPQPTPTPQVPTPQVPTPQVPTPAPTLEIPDELIPDEAIPDELSQINDSIQQGSSASQEQAEDIATSMLKGLTIADAIKTGVEYISQNLINSLKQYEDFYKNMRENQKVTAETATKTLNNAIDQRQKITEHLGVAVKTQTILQAQTELLKSFGNNNSVLSDSVQELNAVMANNGVTLDRATLEFLNNQNLSKEEMLRLGEQLTIASSGENGRKVDMQKLFSDNEKLAQYMMNAQSNNISGAEAQTAYVQEVTRLVSQGMEQTMAQNAALSSLNVKLGNSYLELGNDKTSLLLSQIASAYLPTVDMENKTFSELMSEVKAMSNSSEEEKKRLNDTINTLVKSQGVGSAIDGMNLQNFFNAQSSDIASLGKAKDAQNDSMSSTDKMFQGIGEWLQTNVGSHIQGFLFDANLSETEILSKGFHMIELLLISIASKDRIKGIVDSIKGVKDATKGVKDATGLVANSTKALSGVGGTIAKIGSKILPVVGTIGGIALAVAAVAAVGKAFYEAWNSWKTEEQKHQEGVAGTAELQKLMLDLKVAEKSGDKARVAELQRQIEEKNKELDRIALEEEEASDDKTNLTIGATLGAVGLIAGGVVACLTGVGIPAGLAMVAGGAAILGGGGYAISKLATSEDTEEEKQEAIEERRSHYESGGLVTEEQNAVVGEGGKHELILPLTNTERTKALLEEAKASDQMTPEIRERLYGSRGAEKVGSFDEKSYKLTKGDLMVMAAGSQEGAPYDLTPHNGGYVCNELVAFAAYAANLINDKGRIGVRNNWDKMQKGQLLTQGQAQRGMIGFSGSKKGDPNYTGPTHMGVLSDETSWWNASGSNAKGTIYSYNKKEAEKQGKETFRATENSKGTSLTKMNPSSMRGYGYLEGTFDEATEEDFARFEKEVKSPYTKWLGLLKGQTGKLITVENNNEVASSDKLDFGFNKDTNNKVAPKAGETPEESKTFDLGSAKTGIGSLLMDNRFMTLWGEQRHQLGGDLLNSVLTDFSENLEDKKIQDALGRKSFDAEGAVLGDKVYDDYQSGITSFGRTLETRFAQLKDMFVKDQIEFLTDRGILSREARNRMLDQKAIQELTESVKSLTTEVRAQNRNNDIQNAKSYVSPPTLGRNVAVI